MKCFVCGKQFKDGTLVVPVLTYVTNERRGDFVGTQPADYAHAEHITEAWRANDARKG